MGTALALVLVAGIVSADDAAEKDLKALQGKWSVVKGFHQGKPAPAKELEKVEFEFKDSALVIHEGKSEDKIPFKLDPTQKPKVITESPARKGIAPIELIYEIDGDTLKLAFTKEIEGKRPTSFEAKEGEDVSIVILKRKK